MPEALLRRRVTFAAAHHYRRPEWSEEQNRAAFSTAAEAHSHDYRCDVTIMGPIDPLTGMIMDLGKLDQVLHTEVRQRFHDRDINRDVPEFADGNQVPTCENLARFIFERIQRSLERPVRLWSVVVREDDTLSAQYRT